MGSLRLTSLTLSSPYGGDLIICANLPVRHDNSGRREPVIDVGSDRLSTVAPRLLESGTLITLWLLDSYGLITAPYDTQMTRALGSTNYKRSLLMTNFARMTLLAALVAGVAGCSTAPTQAVQPAPADQALDSQVNTDVVKEMGKAGGMVTRTE